MNSQMDWARFCVFYNVVIDDTHDKRMKIIIVRRQECLECTEHKVESRVVRENFLECFN